MRLSAFCTGVTHGLRCFLRLWLFVASTFCLAEGGEALAGVDANERLYREAILDLQEGYVQLGIGKLQALISKQPEHFGAVLDLAIAYCQSGHRAQAERLWGELEASPQLPPGIGELIAYYRRGKCEAPDAPWRALVALGGGYGDNINQAPSAAFFYLEPLGVSLELTDKARPKRDAFQIVEMGISRRVRESHWGAGFYFQGLNYAQADDFDSNLGQAHLSYRHAIGLGQLDVRGAFSYMTLGGKAYSRGVAGQLSALFPLTPSRSAQAGFSASVSEVNYFSLPDFRSRIVETRGRLEGLVNPRLRLLGEAGWTVDQARGERPGGDKQGPLLQLSAQWMLWPGQVLEVFHRHAWLQDEMAYSPSFFGPVRRKSHQATIYLAWRKELPRDFILRLEARQVSSRDSIALFDYRSSSLGLMFEWWPK